MGHYASRRCDRCSAGGLLTDSRRVFVLLSIGVPRGDTIASGKVYPRIGFEFIGTFSHWPYSRTQQRSAKIRSEPGGCEVVTRVARQAGLTKMHHVGTTVLGCAHLPEEVSAVPGDVIAHRELARCDDQLQIGFSQLVVVRRSMRGFSTAESLSRSPSENPPFALLSASISSLSTWVMNAICIPFGETERQSFPPNTAHLTISCCQQPDQGLLATFRNSDPQRAAPKLLQGR